MKDKIYSIISMPVLAIFGVAIVLTAYSLLGTNAGDVTVTFYTILILGLVGLCYNAFLLIKELSKKSRRSNVQIAISSVNILIVIFIAIWIFDGLAQINYFSSF